MATLDEKRQELEERKKVLQNAQDLYGQYVGGEATIGDLTKRAIKEKLDFNRPINEQESALRAESMTTPTRYAAELKSGRFAGNPILAAKAAAEREAQIQQRLSNVQSMRQERTGTINDIVGTVTAGYQAQTERMKAKAQAAMDAYGITFNEYQQLDKEEQVKLDRAAEQAKLDEEKRQFDIQVAESKSSSRSSGGSGGSGSAKSGGYTAQEIRKLRAAGIDDTNIQLSDSFLYGDLKDTLSDIDSMYGKYKNDPYVNSFDNLSIAEDILNSKGSDDEKKYLLKYLSKQYGLNINSQVGQKVLKFVNG